nr:histidine phosphatase family protein [Streptomyces sp. FT05W]
MTSGSCATAPTKATAPATTPRTKPTLTQEGRDHVRRSLPLPEGITSIVTSPIPRARQTATLVSHLTGLPIVATSGLLAEWRAPSIVLGRTAETYPPAYRAWHARRLANPSLRCEDGESLTDLHIRARHCAAFLHHTAQRHGPVPGRLPHPPAGGPHTPRGRPRCLHDRPEDTVAVCRTPPVHRFPGCGTAPPSTCTMNGLRLDCCS